MFVKMRNNQEGSSLLISMLLMIVIAGLGFVLAAIMLREINLSRTFDSSLESYYAAESGIERSLDIVGENRTTETQGDTVTEIIDYTSSSAYALSNGSTYEIDNSLTRATVDSVLSRLPVANGVQIEFYDPDDSIASTMNAESVEFGWNNPDTATCTHPSPRLEVTFIEYDSTTAFGTDDVVDKYVYNCASGASIGYECMATSNVPTPGQNYIVRLKALDCAIPLVETTFYELPNGTGYAGVGTQVAVEVPSVITIASRGDSSATERLITAKTKWTPSGTGFVDFVLFSLEAITR